MTIPASPNRDSVSGIPLEKMARSGLFVVGLLYNTNGMATWCWEAAHALQEAGNEVILAATAEVTLPGIPKVEVIRLSRATPARESSKLKRILNFVWRTIDSSPDGDLLEIHRQLLEQGKKPEVYFLNQSTLVDRRVPCRQLVVSWSFPITLAGYLGKIPRLLPDSNPRAAILTTLSVVGWWRKDWRAFPEADRVLAISEAALTSLRKRSVQCSLVYPGTSIGPAQGRTYDPIRILMASVSLSEPRKRIVWMLEALKEATPNSDVILELAGEASEEVRQKAEGIPYRVEFFGHLRRDELQRKMQQAHIFCFGSLLDDWGYVLVEAMANGLAPIAPDIAPFNEILGGLGNCYKPTSQSGFRAAVESCITKVNARLGLEVGNRAQSTFSRQSFGRSLKQAYVDACNSSITKKSG